MKLFDKIKNILFEEEEVEIPVIKDEEPPKKEPEINNNMEKDESVSRFKNINYEHEKNDEEHVEVKEPEKEVSPFQQFDEEEFDRIAALNKSRLMERDKRAREEKAKEGSHVSSYYQESNHEKSRNFYDRSNNHLDTIIKKENSNETKHFTPSPVISPVYGILDKNYTKDDILPKASSEGTLPKVIDVDSVRKKAFGALEEDIIEAHNKDDKIELLEESSDVIKDDGNEDLVNTSDIKITSFEDEVDEENNKVLDDNTSLEEEEPVIVNADTESSSDLDIPDETIDNTNDDEEKEKIKETKKEEDSLESDLFNLIDSMYQDKEDSK